MATLPKTLGTRFLLDPDAAKASTEAYGNLHRLVQAGQFQAAHAVGMVLVAPGPWRLSPKSHLQHGLAQAMNWLCAMLGRDCPAVGSEPARTAAQAAAWRDSQGGLASAVPVTPWPIKPDRAWDPAAVEALLGTVAVDRYGSAFNGFREAVQEELRCRVHARVASPWRGAVQPVAPQFAALTDDQLVAAVERGIAIAFPRAYGEDIGLLPLLAAMLDLAGGRRDAAVARLARYLPVAKPPEHEHPFRNWTPYADLLASRALGPPLGITDAAAADYVQRLATRTPFTVASPAPRPWKAVLKAYATRLADDGVDAERLLGTLASGEPEPKPLVARARKGQALNAAASEATLLALESRLGQALPPSYRDFLATSDGLVVPDFVSLLPAADVDWLHVRAPDTVAAWTQDADEATDEEYAVYGADQDCVVMRPRHLHRALQVSTTCDGDVLLLIPGVRFGDEWEAWFLGAKNPGAYRFRSFRDLLEQSVLIEQET